MMPLSEIFFLGIVLYLLYRFIFNFFVPIVRTTKQVREQFRNMHDSMNNPGGPAGPFQHSYTRQAEDPQPQKADPRSSGTSRSSGNNPSSNNTMGEYIDFEEVK